MEYAWILHHYITIYIKFTLILNLLKVNIQHNFVSDAINLIY